MIRVGAYREDGTPGPGTLAEVELDAEVTGPAELWSPEVTVRDERGGALFDDSGGTSLAVEPAAGGGPLAAAGAERRARAFGVGNTAYRAQRLLRSAARLLGRPLPHLTVRIGAHDTPARWGGGHYRLPGGADPAEPYRISWAGEVHLGGGSAYLPGPSGGPYFHAPAHNAAIVCHEVGHHICRHTADFKVNRLRPPDGQHSGKNALDEGTADFLTAITLGTPDIYGWHRGHVPAWDQRRRGLDRRWTMAYLRPGRGGQAHANGTVWASALWSAHRAVLEGGGDGDRFVAMLLRGLVRLGSGTGAEAAGQVTAAALAEERKRRNQFASLLREMVAADPPLAPVVLAAMARHGVHPDGSNRALRERVRAGALPGAAAAALAG
ncbi:hypothetical protein [Streptomyces eurocidicus]|uniref:Metalloprotease n=1 Tax=Streptomyces eurocidicus TaxID=66423 RepID=A0A7W8F3S9_STREU|nr:hypothetical protein [Streptomyces eurocidicus]MBB5120977.1 hypothetical protein [Streptomyces eurocidicus]MBF6055702.1 hypothetical protein [Streptomyces eurocidicus]